MATHLAHRQHLVHDDPGNPGARTTSLSVARRMALAQAERVERFAAARAPERGTHATFGAGRHCDTALVRAVNDEIALQQSGHAAKALDRPRRRVFPAWAPISRSERPAEHLASGRHDALDGSAGDCRRPCTRLEGVDSLHSSGVNCESVHVNQGRVGCSALLMTEHQTTFSSPCGTGRTRPRCASGGHSSTLTPAEHSAIWVEDWVVSPPTGESVATASGASRPRPLAACR